MPPPSTHFAKYFCTSPSDGPNKGKKKCTICDLVTRYSERLQDELPESLVAKLMKNDGCDKYFRDYGAMIPHLKSHGIEDGSTLFIFFEKVRNEANAVLKCELWTESEKQIIYACDGFDTLNRCARPASKLMGFAIRSATTMRDQMIPVANRITEGRLNLHAAAKYATLAIDSGTVGHRNLAGVLHVSGQIPILVELAEDNDLVDGRHTQCAIQRFILNVQKKMKARPHPIHPIRSKSVALLMSFSSAPKK